MPTDLLDRLQENKLHGLEEFLDSSKAVVSTGSADDQAGALADFIVDEGIGVRQGLLRLWDYHWALALAGEVPDRHAHGAKLRSLLERGGKVLARGARAARTYADLSRLEVARLSHFEEQARTFPIWIAECMARWEMLERSPKPLNREQLATAQAAFERGECEDVADILARLERGGPINVKE